MSFKSIVCGVDFSRHSARALRYAAALARVKGAKLTVVFAVDPLLSTAAATAYNSRAIASSARTELHRFVRSALRKQRTPGVGIIVEIGTPAATVLSVAGRLGADVVVVGSHGLTGLRKVFFGSTTEAILRRSPVPVLAVPRTRSLPKHWPAGLVVAPVDMADSVAAEAATASAIAEACGGSLAVVHAIPAMHLPFWERANKRVIDRTRIKLAKDWLNTNLERSGAHAEGRVIIGEMAEAAAAFAARRGASMLVFTLPASGPIGRFLDGAVAYRLVHHARCPVLVVRLRAGRSRRRKRTSRLSLHRVA
ncbi:MAG TPA: universal stress protein [Vicinamibacterales bacterium]|jgi:nucleotide-binding universal stress UspA family protein